MLVNALATVGLVEDFFGIMQTLLCELNSQIRAPVLAALLTLARQSRCTSRLCRVQFFEYCEKLKYNREFADLANAILHSTDQNAKKSHHRRLSSEK
jgi:hypothetical protein